MDTQIRIKLISLVNRHEWSAFIAYKEAQIDMYHKELEWQTDEHFIRTQGKIQECRLDIELINKINNG